MFEKSTVIRIYEVQSGRHNFTQKSTSVLNKQTLEIDYLVIVILEMIYVFY